MHVAYAWAARGTCPRLQVGAVFARDGRTLTSGYNGAPRGMPHCDHELFVVPPNCLHSPGHPMITWPDWMQPFIRRHPDGTTDFDWKRGVEPGSVFTLDSGLFTLHSDISIVPPCQIAVHAEANAVAFAARHGISLEGSTLYTTTMPCATCAKLIINVGAVRVVADRPYARESAGERLLTDAGLALTVNDAE